MSAAGRTGPFAPRTVLLLLGLGAALFVLLLYALSAGWDGRSERDGGAHAASTGLAGFAGLARLLEADGHAVTLARGTGALASPGLLVLTPPQGADGEEIARIIERRRLIGPTLLILPKWSAMPLPRDPRIEAKPGWVALAGPFPPRWLTELPGFEDAELATGATAGWHGLGVRGVLPEPGRAQAVRQSGARNLYPLVRDAEGDMLAAWRFDGGYYPRLAEASGERFFEDGSGEFDSDLWPLVVAIEPDLVNNYGLADADRAAAALALVDAAMQGRELPVVFDLTLAGLGQGRSLLSLAFEPPFLAATLVLLLAAVAIAWRALRRFGAARATLPEFAHGKTQLARNGAALVERTRRLHLLGKPFAALTAARIAARLGLRESDPAAREAAIDRALAARGYQGEGFAARAAALRDARRPRELLRAAGALADIERSLHAQ